MCAQGGRAGGRASGERGVHGVRTGALLIWCVSHTPSSTAVQRSQEELLRNVTGGGDATAQTAQARAASAQSAAGIPPAFSLSFSFFFPPS